jgi:hypothetical protein
LRTKPPEFSLDHEAFHSEGPYRRQIGQGAHPVSRPVAVVKVPQAGTREVVAG